MAGAKQSKRVSWAPGLNLCQVRLFLSEDAPSQSGLGSQDHLQAKPAWLLHSTPPASDDSVPPGFETMHRGQIQRNIPLIKWQCPPNQWLKPEWLVVAGEESQEIASQDRRQIGVLEAVYPRLSSIPPDPSVSSDVQQAPFDDSQAILIPIVAVEDDDAAELPPILWLTAFWQSSNTTKIAPYYFGGALKLNFDDIVNQMLNEEIHRKAAKVESFGSALNVDNRERYVEIENTGDQENGEKKSAQPEGALEVLQLPTAEIRRSIRAKQPIQRLQKIIALSTLDAKYIAITETNKEMN
ncbi:zinc finger CCCH domain-containing protein 30-like [Phalaenopsis equestris]|uniref:zinc finger CCCH domain-containing protein 30-like n=1 Tax=Phalaenopsis equestris TaxID=78828 RepID=UPI0009E2A338|nr:zinc finger CCCH domain-containing protein 30-like [Phalaenopsis equestris]